MGLFTSNCPVCQKEIHWFLTAPKNFKCACGRSVTEEEICKSWEHNYNEHIKVLRRWMGKMVKVIEVIEAEVTYGDGTHKQPFRIVKEYWSRDGIMLAKRDPHYDGESTAKHATVPEDK